MEKIDRLETIKEYSQRGDGLPEPRLSNGQIVEFVGELLIHLDKTQNKLNQVIEGYNEIMKEIKEIKAWKHSKDIENIIMNDK